MESLPREQDSEKSAVDPRRRCTSQGGANAKVILQYLRERTGKTTILRDVHNLVQSIKTRQKGGLTDAERARTVLEECCDQNGGNSADLVIFGERDVATVNTNTNRYKLFSYVVHVFGKGQYVHHALVESEERDDRRSRAGIIITTDQQVCFRLVKAVVTSPINGNAYEVKTFQYKCTFNFMQTWLLSCRHVIPVNNIADGDVEAGGLRLLSGPALPKEPAVSSAAEYQETKVLAEKIMTVMTLQSTPTYSVAHQWLEGFYEALHKGNVVEFTTQQDMSFAGISQISSVGSTRLSQTSCAGGILSSGASAFEHEATKNSLEVDDVTESVDETKAEALISQMPNGNVQNENGNDEDATLGHQAQPEREEVTPNVTEPTPHVTKKDEKELKDRWIFAERPQINGMTKEQRNRAKPQDDRKAARIIAGKYRESKISSFAKFDNVSALLLERTTIFIRNR
ncbi:hypothetical protein PC117_g18605 [Phytophthora cactorum]|uniref:ZSWIM1/3 RNaseH-like domain-containing protein n=1 Tax=Phytophthora cactorum TaxID=29920 RepID=A0A8T1BZ34_9STRA|nr:hypothetical protein PC117_g18605 [Phytophthora cactorum]